MKWYWWLIIAIILVIVAYAAYTSYASKKEIKGNPLNTAPAATTQTGATPCCDDCGKHSIKQAA